MIALLYIMLAATAVTLAGLPVLVFYLMLETCSHRAHARREQSRDWAYQVEPASPSSGSKPETLAA